MSKTSYLGIIVVAVISVVVLLGAGLFYLFFVSFVDNYELGFTFNRFSGEIKALDRTGYFIFNPIKYKVHAIDLRPYQLSITASFNDSSISQGVASRVLNAKLVQFNPTGLKTFVAWHGRGAGDHLSNLKEIMKCYAFDREGGKDCPFIIVLSEINPSQTPTLPDPVPGGKL